MPGRPRAAESLPESLAQQPTLTPKKKRTADESASESHPVQGIEQFFGSFSNTRSMSRNVNYGIVMGIPSPESLSESDWRALDFWRSKRQLSAKKNVLSECVTFLSKKLLL